MEKLSIKLIIIFLCLQNLHAQDSLCVYKTKGIVMIESAANKTLLKKGDVFTGKDKLSISSNSQLTAISSQGDLFIINKEGKYTFKKVLQYKQKKEDKNITSLYIKYLWKEITSHGEKKSTIAVAFRGNSLMRFPEDSAFIFNSKVTLEWKLNEPDSLYHVFLKNKKTGLIYKFETNGSHLVFEKDNPIFDESTEFEWSVTNEAFPNVNNIPFYTFTIIDRESYEQQKIKYQELINDLKAMDYDDNSIDQILCKFFKLCK